MKQIFHTLLSLEEQLEHTLNNIKKRRHIVKKYFDKHAKTTIFEIGQLFLWDSTHEKKGKHTKFQKI